MRDAQAKCLGQTLEAHRFKRLVTFYFSKEGSEHFDTSYLTLSKEIQEYYC